MRIKVRECEQMLINHEIAVLYRCSCENAVFLDAIQEMLMLCWEFQKIGAIMRDLTFIA